jgi:hypothetical protein
MSQLNNAEAMAKQMKISEREYLTKVAEDFDKRIALLAPHCEVKRIE